MNEEVIFLPCLSHMLLANLSIATFIATVKEPVKAPGLESDDIWGDAPDVSKAINYRVREAQIERRGA